MKKKRIYFAALFLGVMGFYNCSGEQNTMPKTNHINDQAEVIEKKHGVSKTETPEDNQKMISSTVYVSGAVKNELEVDVEMLKSMRVEVLENFQVICQSGATVKDNPTSKGVLLKDILERAEINQQNHKDRNFYIVARASDNYKATFSWAEIFNNPTGENVYILFEENGMPIKEKGEMILVSTTDIKTGPRHVYWLKSIEVNRVD